MLVKISFYIIDLIKKFKDTLRNNFFRVCCVFVAMAAKKQGSEKLNVTRSGRTIKKPKELYSQNCVMMATAKENSRKRQRARVRNIEKQKRFQGKKKAELLKKQQSHKKRNSGRKCVLDKPKK